MFRGIIIALIFFGVGFAYGRDETLWDKTKKFFFFFFLKIKERMENAKNSK